MVLRSDLRPLAIVEVIEENEVSDSDAVSAEAVVRLATRLGVPQSWVLATADVPSSTYYARRARGQALAPRHGRALVDLVRVIAAADRLFRDADASWHWLGTPRGVFNGRTPWEMVQAGEVQEVLDLINRIEHGVFS